ncbi:hypothetical protein CAPTEDRAFT_208114 [Capitella teleta]|uniref:G-protein coupled receptors family 1 profile domain-containing protein n=1 Tax=Capitella teleta TaxID=283909 RepID=R7UQK4_CAPTE|nr:hypothetical protein CAPTEDRAFT_208114 [Capitella teleta]|eukprot:ELU08809.1 hypothetical protein CAPTEDRAFT_208114 [Capitella teleta]
MEESATESYYESSEAITYLHEGATPELFIEAWIAQNLDLYGGGLILVVGTVGNIMSIILLRRPRMKTTTTSLYLVALAFTDLSQVVVGQATRHFVRSITGIDPPIYDTWYCKIWYYLIRVFNSYSNWVLAGVTVERCIAILIPLKAKSLITRKSAKLFLSSALLAVFVYYSHSVVSYLTGPTPNGIACKANLENGFVSQVRPWSDWVLEALLPGIIILACNVIIIQRLLKARAERAQTLTCTSDSKDQMQSLVVMLVSISVAYLVLTTPMHVNFVIAASFPGGYMFIERSDAIKRLIWSVSLFLHYTNHSINFFLYVLTGREFRLELKALLGLRQAEKQKGDSNATSVTAVKDDAA